MLDSQAILKVAQLARLKLSAQEAQDYQQQLQKVLENFAKLESVSTEGVEPLITPTPVDLFLREDQVDQNVTVEEIIKCAPESRGNLFKVPPVV
jgi:aspartyl-tRNA(Asn)/glutamyl-tRNA(Gln) amidotransferase subunit C